MTALNAFSKQTTKDTINAFSLGRSRYVIINARKLLFVARTDLKEKSKVVEKNLEEMRDIFFKKFKAEMFGGQWDGDVSRFSVLNEDYARFLLDPEEKMKNSVW
jgi:hypothetical protein